ncbi:hypothetical protein GGR52DRAFT_296441 [Hypoxylon sp. FL1284]|nr:hypothetical protein GGR52DRAFT_296441 [Hypoxylon sp. FL1284]
MQTECDIKETNRPKASNVHFSGISTVRGSNQFNLPPLFAWHGSNHSALTIYYLAMDEYQSDLVKLISACVAEGVTYIVLGLVGFTLDYFLPWHLTLFSGLFTTVHLRGLNRILLISDAVIAVGCYLFDSALPVNVFFSTISGFKIYVWLVYSILVYCRRYLFLDEPAADSTPSSRPVIIALVPATCHFSTLCMLHRGSVLWAYLTRNIYKVDMASVGVVCACLMSSLIIIPPILEDNQLRRFMGQRETWTHYRQRSRFVTQPLCVETRVSGRDQTL